MDKNDKLKEKLDLLSALKEDEEATQKIKVIKKENSKKKEVSKQEKDAKKEEVLKEIKKVKDTTPKKNNIPFTIIAFASLVITLTYFIYNIVKATDQVNQPYLIINSAILFVINIFLVLTGFIQKKNIQKGFQTFNVLLISLYGLFQFSVSSGILKLPTLTTIGDFSNISINEVIKWASNNNITLEQTYEYSDLIESNHIISQDVPANTLLKGVKKIEVIVSNGPNYESIVNIPNMIGWNVDDVVAKIKEAKLNNVQIDFEFNEVTERDIEFEQSKSGEMRRNEELILKFSLGREEDLEPVNLKELKDMEEFDAILWLKRNGIKYEIEYEFSDTTEAGKVISTTPEADTLIVQLETTVKIIISKGPKITAPDFTKMSLDEITEWAIKNKITIVYESEYNNDIKAGSVIRVSVKEGDILEENDRIYIVTSKGSLKMFSYTDGDIVALRNFAAEHKITLTENEEFSDTIEKGKFISVSLKPGDIINTGDEITVVVSLGSSIEIPNFIGMSADKAKQTCSNLGITCKLSYVYSSNTKGNVFNQSMNAGSKVIAGTNVVLTISNGKKTNNSGGNSSNQGNNGSSTTNPPTVNPDPPAPTCTEKNLGNLIIQESWLSIGNSGKTISSLQSKLSTNYPGATFNIVAKAHNSLNSGLIHPDSPTNNGTVIKSCNTYTIYIVE